MARARALAVLAGAAWLADTGTAHAAPPGEEGGYAAVIAAKRTERVQRLTAPDGWLTLIGLHWLEPGASTVGAAADNRIVLAAGPARFGTVELTPEGQVRFTPAAATDTRTGTGTASVIEIDGGPATPGTPVELRDDRIEGVRPTRVRAGSVSFHVIDRHGRKGLRVRDAEAVARREFLGIDTFPLDPAWRIEATWVPLPEPRQQPIVNVLGDVEPEPVVGKAVFTHAGHTIELLPVWDGTPEERLFFILSDATSGHETYGAARFIYAEPPRDGKVIVDFNLALNPPCAFTPFATCPLPPAENRLPFPVRAGEKRYRGEPGAH